MIKRVHVQGMFLTSLSPPLALDSELLVAVISMTVPSLPEVSAIPYPCSLVSLLDLPAMVDWSSR